MALDPAEMDRLWCSRDEADHDEYKRLLYTPTKPIPPGAPTTPDAARVKARALLDWAEEIADDNYRYRQFGLDYITTMLTRARLWFDMAEHL